MEIFVNNIPYDTSKPQLQLKIAEVIHGPAFADENATTEFGLINFDVRIFPARNKAHQHSGRGALTLPWENIGSKFLDLQNSGLPQYRIMVGSRTIHFTTSRNIADQILVEHLKKEAFIGASQLKAREEQYSALSQGIVRITEIQFGWICLDQVFSPEYNYQAYCSLSFKPDRREIRVEAWHWDHILHMVISVSEIDYTGCNSALPGEPSIIFQLRSTPRFEYQPLYNDDEDGYRRVFENGDTALRTRLSAFGVSHENLAGYTSLSVRLACEGSSDVEEFLRLSSSANLHMPHDYDHRVEKRNLFSADKQDQFRHLLSKLPYEIAFQLEGCVQEPVADIREMLLLAPKILEVQELHGSKYTARLLRHFRARMQDIWNDTAEQTPNGDPALLMEETFNNAINTLNDEPVNQLTDSDHHFQCFHCTVYPSTYKLSGPFVEQNFRTIRRYPGCAPYFLRVRFVDDNGSKFHHDRDVDSAKFAMARYGKVMKEGITVGGKQFKFLAYSMSSLKQHSVWFVRPFMLAGRYIGVKEIIEDIGIFDNLDFDPELMYCPARYGARISQAFTTTESSIEVEAEDIQLIPDVSVYHNGRKSLFTDGVGKMSPEFAKAVADAVTVRRGIKGAKHCCFQIRFGGTKGMLSVDHTLTGREVHIRDSMIKFAAPNSMMMEIAETFLRPKSFKLNRPLVMLLEGLGVPYETFEQYQDEAVREAVSAASNLESMASLVIMNGLGSAFRVANVISSLIRLGLKDIDSQSYERMKKFAINHVLRAYKYKCNIPIPGAWTLVGIADEFNELKSDEIYACVEEDNVITYLEGDVLISRSPAIHPGDIQVVHAIGKPKSHSHFLAYPMHNVVIFSVKGTRSIPSMLGGGDLDGDIYNIIPLNKLPNFQPRLTFSPELYPEVPRTTLDTHCTDHDRADFVVNYINSDVLGVIASKWLMQADATDVLDESCETLARLHSEAVDFQKSGTAVDFKGLPRIFFTRKPDWSAPETIPPGSDDYYQSTKALGKLFRRIDLTTIDQLAEEQAQPRPRIYPRRKKNEVEDFVSLLNNLRLNDSNDLFSTIRDHFMQYTSPLRVEEDPIMMKYASDKFFAYTEELATMCATFTIGPSAKISLTEEEVVLGTIIAKSPSAAHRQDTMAKLRDHSNHIVSGIRNDLLGDGHEDDNTLPLKRSWAAWQISAIHSGKFGAWSFGWIAMGALFEAIKVFEDSSNVPAQREDEKMDDFDNVEQ